MKMIRNLEAPFSSASGLLLLDQKLFCICDSENALYVQEIDELFKVEDRVLFASYHLEGATPGPLPKKIKSDWESISSFHHEVWVWPSFSKSSRCRLGHFKNGNFVSLMVPHFYDQFREFVQEPNIEGSLFWKDQVVLFQRGNSSFKENGYFQFSQREFPAFLKGEKVQLTYQPVDLGTWQGNPITWSEACKFNDEEILISGVVEKTDTPFEDGEVLGSRIGIFEFQSQKVKWLFEIEKLKLEGLAFEKNQVIAVTDADNENERARIIVFAC